MTREILPGTVQYRPRGPSGWARTWRALTQPHSLITDITARLQVQLGAIICLSLLLITAIAITANVFQRGLTSPLLIPLGVLFVILLAAYILTRTRNYRIGISLLVWTLAAAGYANIGSGAESPIGGLAATVLPAFVAASLLLPVWELITLIGVNVAALLVLPIPNMDSGTVGTTLSIYFIMGILITVGVYFRNSIENRRIDDLDRVNQELKAAQAGLEERVEDRTGELRTVTFKASRTAGQLQAISEVAHAISLVTDIEELLRMVCHLISEQFAFYHVGIFLLDDNAEYAVLRAANSEGGQRMLERGHRLKVGQTGLVGYATQHGEPRIALDVGQDAVFFDNPDLPDTRSEIALPLMLGQRIIGALDVQSAESAAFSEEDIEVMHTLSDQVAIAIENARLYGETRRALEEAQTIYNRFVRQEWERITLDKPLTGFQTSPKGVVPLKKRLDQPEVRSALQSGEVVASKEGKPALAIPIRVRGETIGILDIRVPDPARIWKEDEINAIQRVVDRTALALESARLLAESEQRAQREQVIGKVSNRIRQTLDLDTVLKTAAGELRQALNLKTAEVRLGIAPETATEDLPSTTNHPV
ncbi:MAG: GAF domain-containing protein [Anaerolineales bacterium]|nr:GAF domain-containing protein [Anaerolineales bacterium]